jgi:hypothetical protein
MIIMDKQKKAMSTFCQSCRLPFGGELRRGIDENGRVNPDYRIGCFREGKFNKPNLTLDELTKRISRLADPLFSF